MAGISGVNGIDEETLYYQYLINHNSASTMLNALSGSTSEDDSLLSGLSSLSGLAGSSALSGLSGTSGLSGVGQDSSFATVLQSYLSKAVASQNDSTQDAQNTDQAVQSTHDAAQSTNNTAQSTYASLEQAALAGQEYDFSSMDRIIDQMFSESTPLS